MARPIGTLGTIPTLTIGSRVFTDLSTLIILYGGVASGGANTTYRKAAQSSGYPVTGGKTLTLYAATGNSNTAAAGPILLYADNDVTIESGTAFTNPVYLAGQNSKISAMFVFAGASDTPRYWNGDFAVPAGKYVGSIIVSSITNVVLYGYET